MLILQNLIAPLTSGISIVVFSDGLSIPNKISTFPSNSQERSKQGFLDPETGDVVGEPPPERKSTTSCPNNTQEKGTNIVRPMNNKDSLTIKQAIQRIISNICNCKK